MMAKAAGLYVPLWRPEESEPPMEYAGELIPHLRVGLAHLEASPHLASFGPKNRWGTYVGLVDFTRRYLAACEAHPDALVRVCR